MYINGMNARLSFFGFTEDSTCNVCSIFLLGFNAGNIESIVSLDLRIHGTGTAFVKASSC